MFISTISKCLGFAFGARVTGRVLMAKSPELRTQIPGWGGEVGKNCRKKFIGRGGLRGQKQGGYYGNKPCLTWFGRSQWQSACPDPARPGPVLLPAVFAFSRSYALLLIARSLQGIGSSCSSVAGRCGRARVSPCPGVLSLSQGPPALPHRQPLTLRAG